MLNNKNDVGNNQYENEDELTLTKRLRILAIMTIVLAILRLLSLDIIGILGDLLTALMIYFYSQTKTKCMAIFCLFNGGIGLIYAFIKISQMYTLTKINWFNVYYMLLFLISLYDIFVYLAICYLSYLGITKYQMGFDSSQIPAANNGSNYGAINVNNHNNNNFTPFHGRGQTVG